MKTHIIVLISIVVILIVIFSPIYNGAVGGCGVVKGGGCWNYKLNLIEYIKYKNQGKIPKVTEDIRPATTHPDIQVYTPTTHAIVTSPLMITGKAKGGWYFEANFPVSIVDWDGKIISTIPAQAQGDWMTSEFVPFTASITFTKPPCATGQDYCKRGTLILQKDNPSGMPEHDAAVEIPINFE